MRALIAVGIVLAAVCPTSLVAQKFIPDEYLKGALRKAMPPSAQCREVVGIGPSCEYKEESIELTADKDVSGQVNMQLRFPIAKRPEELERVQEISRTFVVLGEAFGFPQPDIDRCITSSTTKWNTTPQQQRSDIGGMGWGDAIAEKISNKQFKIFCRSGISKNKQQIDLLMMVNNDF